MVDRPHVFDPDSEYWTAPKKEAPLKVNFEQFQLDRLIQMLRKVDDEDDNTGTDVMDPFRVSLLKMVIIRPDNLNYP